MSYHPFTNVLEYIPKKYVGLSNKQLQDRSAVYAFKEGNCPDYAKIKLVEKIRNIIGDNPSAWVVCFIPASTQSRHIRRYQSLSNYLTNRLSCPVYTDGIEVSFDRESGYLTGKTETPTDNMKFNPSRFSGKKVILIDDVRTRGVTFNQTADKMIAYGAASVYGVFLAQTIHPNLPVDTSSRGRGGYYDDVLNEILAEEAYEIELQNELMAEEAYEIELENELLAEEALYGCYY